MKKVIQVRDDYTGALTCSEYQYGEYNSQISNPDILVPGFVFEIDGSEIIRAKTISDDDDYPEWYNTDTV